MDTGATEEIEVIKDVEEVEEVAEGSFDEVLEEIEKIVLKSQDEVTIQYQPDSNNIMIDGFKGMVLTHKSQNRVNETAIIDTVVKLAEEVDNHEEIDRYTTVQFNFYVEGTNTETFEDVEVLTMRIGTQLSQFENMNLNNFRDNARLNIEHLYNRCFTVGMHQDYRDASGNPNYTLVELDRVEE